jgi:8-oxo-dGTP pyrophosphatase MutT (NUDIX family)
MNLRHDLIYAPMPLAGLLPAPDVFIVGALLVTTDGRYLFQLRDDKPGLPLRNHWALFGGEVEPGEDGHSAILREVEEELTYRARECTWYHEAIYALPRHHRRIVRKAYYLMPIRAEEVAAMVQCEGADMRLMIISDLLALPNIAPWDLSVALLHARERTIFPMDDEDQSVLASDR